MGRTTAGHDAAKSSPVPFKSRGKRKVGFWRPTDEKLAGVQLTPGNAHEGGKRRNPKKILGDENAGKKKRSGPEKMWSLRK